MVITNNSTDIWDVMPCSLVEMYENFGGTCYHLRAKRTSRGKKRAVSREREFPLPKHRENATRLHGVTFPKDSTLLIRRYMSGR
jgi:hypothetical protein